MLECEFVWRNGHIMCELQADRAVDTNPHSTDDRENKIHRLLSTLWEKQARDKSSNLQEELTSLTTFFLLFK